ncbi:MAG TPA: hypothetical protein DCS42_10930 [Nitrospiraceae bacterium]|nr:hypothetical protein [Nitrospiraceae bacterium]
MSKTVLTKTPRCPVEIYRIAEQEGFVGDYKKGRAERSEYIKQQVADQVLLQVIILLKGVKA